MVNGETSRAQKRIKTRWRIKHGLEKWYNLGQFATSLNLTVPTSIFAPSTSADRVATVVLSDCAPISNDGGGAAIANRAAPISFFTVNVDSLFDSSFELIDAVDRASQTMIFDMVVDRDERENNVTMEQEQPIKSTNNNSTLKAIFSRTFKSVNFGQVDNCTFNFYLGNGLNN